MSYVKNFTAIFPILQTSTLATKQDPLGPSQNKPPPHVLCLPSVCRNTLASWAFPEFQRVNLIREMRKCRKENTQTRQNNNSLAIKQSQGPLAASQGLQIIFWAVSFELFCTYWDPHQMEARRPQTGWNQKADDADSHQPMRRMSGVDHTRHNPAPSPCL